MRVINVAVYGIVWIFIVFVMFQVGNYIIFQHVKPIMLNLANSTALVNYDRYVERVNVIVAAYNIAMFILLITPFIYIFVRLLLKKEPSQQPIYYNGMGGGF
jgi:hypothetical protein